MKTRNGFISIIALIVMSVSMIMIAYLQYITYLESLIVIATEQGIQSSYNAESKILLSMHDEVYLNSQLIPNIYDVFRKGNFTTNSKFIKIDKSDLNGDDIYSTVKMAFSDRLNRKKMILETECRINGKKTRANSEVSLVNKLFEIEKSVLNLNDIEDEYYFDLARLIDKIESDISLDGSNSYNIYGFETNSYEDIVLDTYRYNRSIKCSRSNMDNPYREFVNKSEVFILAKKYGEKPLNFNISSSNKLGENKLSGIIYVEGDINILAECYFNGIMVINGGKLNIIGEADISISGMLIYINSDSPYDAEKFNVVYNRDILYKYGTYIPGFIDMDIELIKIY